MRVNFLALLFATFTISLVTAEEIAVDTLTKVTSKVFFDIEIDG